MADPQGSSVADELRSNFRRFEVLVELAERNLGAGRPQTAAALAQIAGRCAFPDFSGIFASSRMERLLLRLGTDLRSSPPKRTGPAKGSRRRVLHVLTYARPVGGDCRFVGRWMVEDKASVHSVAVVSQTHYRDVFEIPGFLIGEAEASGGSLIALRASASRPLDQARELRGLCQQADVVALHLWPHDIVPVIALAAGCDAAKTVFINHSDHTFWVGGSASHSIAHLRTQYDRFLSERRALVPERSTILPIPLAHRPVSAGRAEAKAALGLPPDAVVLLTVASAFKFSAPGQVGFLELVTPVLKKFGSSALFAIGPNAEGAWKSASAEVDGRVVALGPRWNNDLYFAAADIYLDSVPFSSITSLLEAGSQGLPVVGLERSTESQLLGAGAPGIEGVIELARDGEAYRDTLSRLIEDEEYRRHSGRRLQAQILARHTGEGWLDSLRATYSALDGSLGRGCMKEDEDRFHTGELDQALARLYAHAFEPRRAHDLIRNYVGALPYGSRISVTRKLHRAGLEVPLLNLAPPPLNAILRVLGRSGKRLIGRLRS